MQIRRLLSLALLFLALIQGASAQSEPPTLAQYEQLVREAYAAATRSDRIGLDETAAQLTAAAEIALPDGTTLPVDNQWLADALAEEPPPYRLIAARLGAILDAVGQTRNTQDPQALSKLDEVFSRPPFQDREAPSAWTQFWRSVGQAIENFFNSLGNAMPNPPSGPATAPQPSSFGSLSPVGWVMLVIGVLLVLALVLYAIRGVRGSLVRDAKAREEAALEEENITATEALDRAQDQARTGDYRTAVRYLYLSSLLWLDEHKLLRYDRSLTNREYLDQVRSNGPLSQQLAPVVSTFERVWYGKREIAEQDFLAYEAQIQELRGREPRS
ncbi:MAG TPA: DUF4129 domain-containing protein [Herpetosiphonaceae bacterium]